MNIHNKTFTAAASSTAVIDNRAEIVLVVGVKNSNPNGDPDMGNRPRMLPSGEGLISDVCIKRKIRNAVEAINSIEPQEGYEIYMGSGSVLNDAHKEAFEKVRGQKVTGKTKAKDGVEQGKLYEYLTRRYFDIRTFGAVMELEMRAGQVRGPVQVSFFESIEPIDPLDVTITRQAASNFEEGKDNKTMGSKWIVPQAAYRGVLYINPLLAAQTGFSEADLDMLQNAIHIMFEIDRTATRSDLRVLGAVMFRHESPFGNAPAHALVDRVKVTKVDGGHAVTVDDADLPTGVTVTRII